MPDTIVAPVFPLPSLVFFPRTWLPLHIFEPRYVEMTGDVLEGNGVIAMAHLRPNWEEDYEGTPPVYDVATLGKVMRGERLPSGRYNILLYGVKRVQIEEELDRGGKLYRRARISFVESDAESNAKTLEEAKNRLLALCHRLVELRPTLQKSLGRSLSEHRDPDLFADIVAGFLSSAFNIGAYERQSILEEASVARRLQLINIQAGKIVGELVDGAI